MLTFIVLCVVCFVIGWLATRLCMDAWDRHRMNSMRERVGLPKQPRGMQTKGV